MTDDFSVPDASADGPLTAVQDRVTSLVERLGLSGREAAEVFDHRRLSTVSGVPEERVGALLAGRPVRDTDVQTRFLQRIELLRRTRRKPNGRPCTQQEIADGAGMSRQQAGALINGDRRPTMEHCAAIQRFFGVHAGFLTAEDTDALAYALAATERDLLQRLDREERGPGAAADPLRELLRRHGVRDIAWRAAQLPTDQHREKVAEWLDMLLESVTPRRDRGPDEPS
ncbi:helix-turn-helix domain-containing protein [Streptomyces sp. NPDC050560]|uniref:helix-turn-helix domain-containing protein n=1 Tax=Streptomyces sp. NPDC050560 TaxID=3365630 RepID=UPI00378C9DFD